MLLVLLPIAAGWTGCERKPTPPVVTKVETIPLPVRQIIDVDPELLKRCEWPKDWPKRRVLESNRIRGKCLEQYEGQLDGIEALKK